MKDERLLKYQQIENYLLREISSGRYVPGERFFTENAIAERFHATAVTARKAFSALEERGYIVRRRGSGTFVRRLPERPLRLTMATRCVIGLFTGESGIDNSLKLGRMIFSLHQAIEEAGYLTMLGGETPEALLECGIQAAIVIGRIAPENVRKLTDAKIPAAALYPDPEITLPEVQFDYREAAERIVREFRSRGAERVMLTGIGDDAEIMLRAFEPPFREACSTSRSTLATASGAGASELLDAWLDGDDGVRRNSALFVLNSWSLPMVEDTLNRRRRRPGRDLSLLVHGSNALLIPGSPGYSIIDIDPTAAARALLQLLREEIRTPGAGIAPPPVPYGKILNRGSLLERPGNEPTNEHCFNPLVNCEEKS